MNILWPISLLAIFGLGYWVGVLNHRRKAHDAALGHVQEKSELLNQLQTFQTKYETLQSTFESFKSQGEELTSTMKTEFKLMAQTLLEEKSTRFLDLNQKNMFGLLEPLKERLKDFEKKVDEVYAAEGRERGMLRGELNKLIELNMTMSQEARNLTQALKGENKTQGNWGELVLESILEKSGLRAGHEFITQGEDMQLRGENGSACSLM